MPFLEFGLTKVTGVLFLGQNEKLSSDFCFWTLIFVLTRIQEAEKHLTCCIRVSGGGVLLFVIYGSGEKPFHSNVVLGKQSRQGAMV